ncbi:MAG: hypothetical protein WCX82_04420 [archaeon]|jgi:hypothetical protein
MQNNFKYLFVVFFLLISTGPIFAEDNLDWITFNDQNKNITPIIFGRITIDNPEFSFCNAPFLGSAFSPNLVGEETSISNNFIFSNGNKSINFFLRNTGNKDPQILVAKDFIWPYTMSTIFCYTNSVSENNSVSLPFVFKQVS